MLTADAINRVPTFSGNKLPLNHNSLPVLWGSNLLRPSAIYCVYCRDPIYTHEGHRSRPWGGVGRGPQFIARFVGNRDQPVDQLAEVPPILQPRQLSGE